MTTPREEAKAQRRAKAEQDFIKQLNDAGGYYNFAETAKYLGLSYDELNSLISKRAVLGFKLNDEDIFPKFQFENNKMIQKYDELLPLFNVSNLTASSFMITGYIGRGNEELSYYDAMKNISAEEFEFIKRDAKLFGVHISN